MEEKIISEKLLLLRKKACLSQMEVANELGISRQTLSKWETGKSCPDALFIKKISEIYKISIDELLESNYNVQHEKAYKKPINSYRKWLLLGIVDFLLCSILVYYSRPMLFWVLNFNFILLSIIVLIYFFNLFKAKIDCHK